MESAQKARQDGWREGRFGVERATEMAAIKPYEHDGAARLAFWQAHREGSRARKLVAV